MSADRSMLQVLQHALGRDEHGRGPDYRNHFCTSPPCEEWDACERAVVLGLMVKRRPRAISGGDWIFTVTEAGRAYVTVHSPAPPKLTKGQQRYQRWMSVNDATGEAFGAWLKRGSP